MQCTLVIPCHNEEGNIVPLYEAIRHSTKEYPQLDILFVDDGSTDGTLDKIKALRHRDKRVKFLSFSTNYGHQKALIAGLKECKSAIAITMDGDLQHPPKYIPVFIEEYLKGGVDVVLGRRTSSQEGVLKPFFSRMFYLVFQLVTGIRVIPHTSDFRLVSRRVIDILSGLKDSDPFVRGIIARLNLPSRIIDYDLEKRKIGRPSYTFTKSLRMALSSFLRFSGLPYRLGIFVGSMGVILSMLEAAHYFYLRVFTNLLVPGQADLMIFLGIISSFILIMLSLLFKVVTQIRDELIGDPSYVIAEKSTD